MDAEPRPPRPTSAANDDTGETHNESEGNSNESEESFIGPENNQENNEPNRKKNPGKSKKNKTKKSTNESSRINTLSTQAGGSVFNIIDSPDFHLGHDFVYNLGPTTQCKHPDDSETLDNDDDHIEQTNEITLLMESKISPEHEYIDYISKNLGKNWRRFFRKLGYTKGRIDTFEIDQFKNGVSEARYQLLLDWIRNEEDGTLGRLSTALWNEGEREIVKGLSIIYSTKNYK